MVSTTSVRKRFDLIVFEFGPKADPIRHYPHPHIRPEPCDPSVVHARNRHSHRPMEHTGQWKIVPIVRAGARDVFETVVRELPWLLVPIP